LVSLVVFGFVRPQNFVGLSAQGAGGVIVAATAQSELSTGADWAAGIVVVEFTRTLTAITKGTYILSIQTTVTDGGKKSEWQAPLIVGKGMIA